MITAKQIKAARSLLGISQQDLADMSGISKPSIINIENMADGEHPRILDKVIQALEYRNIEFISDDGVRLIKKEKKQTLKGQPGMRAFYDDVYNQTKETNKEICIFNGLPNELLEWAGEDWYLNYHAPRMKALSCTSKNILDEGEKNLIGSSFALYNFIPKKDFQGKMLYVYGNKFAYMDFNDDVTIHIIEETRLADTFRVLFNFAWEKSTEPDK